jgi:hypothetical protein
MPFIKAHYFWFWLKPLPKMVLQFMKPLWIFELSHMYLNLSILNPINILKCSNTLGSIFRQLRIFSNMPLIISRVFGNGIVFLLFQNTEQKQIKRKRGNRAEELTWSPPAGPPGWPSLPAAPASCLPRQAGS